MHPRRCPGHWQTPPPRTVARRWSPLAQPPLPVGAIRDDADPEADFEAQKRFTPWTSLWNVCGLPAVSLPVHRTSEGLPVGAMVAGRPADDAGLFALAARVEQAYAEDGQVWKDVHPPCW